jgi:hypothetical protein
LGDAWITTIRIAQQLGGVHTLFPDGVHRLTDLPYTLHDAILAALNFISFDELLDDERPPRKIWGDGEKLNLWFEDVKRRRNEKYGQAESGKDPIKDPVRNGAVDLLIAE